MTDKQKQAIRILNNLNERCGEELFGDEEYFLLLEFVIGGGSVELINTPWNVPWNERKTPFDMPITVMYGCGTDAITYAQDGITLKATPDPCNKIEEQQ